MERPPLTAAQGEGWEPGTLCRELVAAVRSILLRREPGGGGHLTEGHTVSGPVSTEQQRLVGTGSICLT